MKIRKIELEGFRGIRERVSIALPSGFAVIVGRNGTGKSTICDAVEFALTGTISRHRAGSEKGEGIDQYLWWRGAEAAEDRFVSLTLSDDDGRDHTITRRPDGKEPANLEAITSRVCSLSIDPSKGLADVCKTSIIRDELITDLSVDMSENERFEFVRAAVGSANISSIENKLNRLQDIARSKISSAEVQYSRHREKVVQLVAEISRLRSDSLVEREIDELERALHTILQRPDADGQGLISAGRKFIADRRLRIDRISQLYSRVGAKRETGSNIPYGKVEQELARARKEFSTAQEVFQRSSARTMALRETLSSFELSFGTASSLAQLYFHGSRLGLSDDRCPLCGSKISEGEFRIHLAEIETALEASQLRITEVVKELSDSEKLEREQSSIVLHLKNEIESLTVAAQEAAEFNRIVGEALGLTDVDLPPVEAVATEILSLLESLREELGEIESIVTQLEAAQRMSSVVDKEKELEIAQNESHKAELVLALTQEASARIKDGIDSLKRLSGEIVDVRLASISPLLEELYARLKPHIDWPEISYLIRGDVRRLLSLRVGDGLNLRYLFSSGQRRAAGLAFLLAVALSRPWCNLRTAILDDPVQHIDDYRALHLTETLAAIRKSDIQVICTVEDAELGALLARRLRSATSDEGLIVEMKYEAGSGASIEELRPVLPFPTEVLLSA